MSATRREVRDDQHGTYTAYAYGCRCDECKRAQSAHSHHVPQGDCIQQIGVKASRCQQLAGHIVTTEAEFRRVAAMANRSAAAFARHRDQLAAAKADRDEARRQRDEHASECEGAAARWPA